MVCVRKNEVVRLYFKKRLFYAVFSVLVFTFYNPINTKTFLIDTVYPF